MNPQRGGNNSELRGVDTRPPPPPPPLPSFHQGQPNFQPNQPDFRHNKSMDFRPNQSFSNQQDFRPNQSYPPAAQSIDFPPVPQDFEFFDNQLARFVK